MPDPVTHLSVGFVVARHCCRENKAFFLCCSIIPDIDGLIGLLYMFFFLPSGMPSSEIKAVFESFHPSFSASFLFLPFFAGLILVISRRTVPGWMPPSMKKSYALILLAILVHLTLDMLMTGNRPFWPLPLEAGLSVIPYSNWGIFVPMVTGISLVVADLILFPDKSGKSDRKR